MARPAKPTNLTVKHLTKEEKNTKSQTENKLKGSANKLHPPKWMTDPQKKIFRYIVNGLKEADILGNLDIYILIECSIALERMHDIEMQINFSPDLVQAKELGIAKDRYTRSFFRCCSELSLSPKARAALGNAAINNTEKENPIVKALMDDDGD